MKAKYVKKLSIPLIGLCVVADLLQKEIVKGVQIGERGGGGGCWWGRGI